MVEPRYNQTCDIYRLERSGNTGAYGGDPVYEAIPFQILPAGPEILAVYGGQPSFALYECWTGKTVTLKNGDKLVAGDRAWIVRGEPQVVADPLLAYVRVIGQEVV
jgi:hypothetical protein